VREFRGKEYSTGHKTLRQIRARFGSFGKNKPDSANRDELQDEFLIVIVPDKEVHAKTMPLFKLLFVFIQYNYLVFEIISINKNTYKFINNVY